MTSEQIRKALARYDRWMSLEHTMVLGDETIHIFAEAARLYADLLENELMVWWCVEHEAQGAVTTEWVDPDECWQIVWGPTTVPYSFCRMEPRRVVPVSTTTPTS